MPQEQEIIRFKFFKKNELKYLSHLDMMAMLSRAFLRAGIKAQYSSGFNPKPRLSLSNPIPLGVQSLAEYGDLVIAEKLDADDFKKRVNSQLPLNIQVSQAVNAGPGTASLMSIIDLLFYDFEISGESGKYKGEILGGPVKDNLENKFKEEFSDIISGCPEGCRLHSYEFTQEMKPEIHIPVLKLKVFGYARIFRKLQNNIFKLNEFIARFKRLLQENEMKIDFIQKTEVYIINEGRLLNPIEILHQ